MWISRIKVPQLFLRKFYLVRYQLFCDFIFGAKSANLPSHFFLTPYDCIIWNLIPWWYYLAHYSRIIFVAITYRYHLSLWNWFVDIWLLLPNATNRTRFNLHSYLRELNATIVSIFNSILGVAVRVSCVKYLIQIVLLI